MPAAKHDFVLFADDAYTNTAIAGTTNKNPLWRKRYTHAIATLTARILDFLDRYAPLESMILSKRTVSHSEAMEKGTSFQRVIAMIPLVEMIRITPSSAQAGAGESPFSLK